MSNYRAIYKCRLCGKTIEKEAYAPMGNENHPTATLCYFHLCEDGRHGIIDLQGIYKVKEE